VGHVKFWGHVGRITHWDDEGRSRRKVLTTAQDFFRGADSDKSTYNVVREVVESVHQLRQEWPRHGVDDLSGNGPRRLEAAVIPF